ncbi:1-phosphofructokinase family hexose kinase [Brevibacillus fluminis]|uniref:Tagatose-6-phosphate kinase n=1 Tax=Brevibacillus fluminis TaxID=511487 RepID=A0A3M8DJ73_9BACL|nr:1-phosphofructokinase family hexose kinase [Brevibacillus fluminis]RNB87177.1 1-phosphofructokinase family hexose kinase [Brevibacillus fluminis]
MIVTVTLNAAIDKTYVLSSFTTGALHRPQQVLSLAGGKGINVARVARTLGIEVTATGFIAGYNGKMIAEGCAKQAITPSFCEIAGESRTCMTFLDASSGSVTEVLESGPAVDPEAFASFRAHLGKLAAQARYVVMSGSLPQGLVADSYKLLIEEIKAAGAIPVLDTSGEALARALPAEPFLIKPNRAEAEALLGYPLADLEARRKAVADLMRLGARHVLLSLGEEGALLGGGTFLYELPALPQGPVVNPVGCGDALLAGVVTGLVRGYTLAEAATLGIACAATNAMSLGAGVVQIADVERLWEQTVCTAVK